MAKQPEVEIFGTYRWRSPMDNLSEEVLAAVSLVETDLRDAVSVTTTVDQVRPDLIFHLAAQSFVPTSWRSPAETMGTNVTGQIHIFEAIRELEIDPVVQIACSSEEYGLVLPDEVPIKETNPLRPLSPYAVSKVAQDYLGYQYHQSYGIKAIRTRGFNHTGPRRGEVFVTSNFARQIAEIEAGKREAVIHVGNLDAVRDFTDVRDMVRGYWLATQKAEPGEVYNLASGRGITIRELLDQLLALSDAEVEIKTDPDRLRPSDVEVLLGDYSKFHQATGWEPEIPFETTLKDTIDYWRQRIASS